MWTGEWSENIDTLKGADIWKKMYTRKKLHICAHIEVIIYTMDNENEQKI